MNFTSVSSWVGFPVIKINILGMQKIILSYLFSNMLMEVDDTINIIG